MSWLVVVLGVVGTVFIFLGVRAQESEAQIEERLVSYQRCRIDSDCRENSFCYDNDNNRIGLCKCQAGYELLIRNISYYACLPFVPWGEACQIDEQCTETLGSLARCNKVCGCAEGTHRYPRDGRCYTSILLEDFCRTDANCVLADGSFAYCVDGQCECNNGFSPTPDKRSCVIVRNIGENCTSDLQCSFTSNSVCREVCRCGVGYVISRNGTTCLKAATHFFDECEENAQCSDFLRDSLCSYGNCTCDPGYHGYETRCVRSAGIGQPCTAQDQCIPGSQFLTAADCVEGVCKCLAGANGLIGCPNASAQLSSNVYLFIFFLLLIFKDL